LEKLREKLNQANLETAYHGILPLINDVQSAIERESYIHELAGKLRVSPGVIRKDLKKLNSKSEPKQMHESTNACFPGLIDLVLDENGEVTFLVKTSDGLQLLNEWIENESVYKPPQIDDLPYLLARAEEVIRYYEQEDGELFNDILVYLKRFSFLPKKQFLIIGLFVLLTYLQDHPDIHYLPTILFYAVPERGKSRTGKAMVYTAYRGIHVIDMREANLFRFSANLQATIFFDLMNIWKKAERSESTDILLLRNEKGAKVPRVLYPDRVKFKDTVFYSVFGPTIIATNEDIHKILDTRCIQIIIPNAPGNYENPTPELGRVMKERLTAWRAKNIFTPLPNVEPIPGISGRLWDISKPLFQVCNLTCSEFHEELRAALLEIAGKRSEDKRESTEGKLVSIIRDLSESESGLDNWEIKVSDVREKYNENLPEQFQKPPQWISKRLTSLGLKTRKSVGQSLISLDRSGFDLLCNQYALYPPEKQATQATQATEAINSTTYDVACPVASETGHEQANA
jgi:hypothetical protein